jgi:hypothetical protein
LHDKKWLPRQLISSAMNRQHRLHSHDVLASNADLSSKIIPAPAVRTKKGTFFFSDSQALTEVDGIMPRTARAEVGDLCYHVINRGNAQCEVFHKAGRTTEKSSGNVECPLFRFLNQGHANRLDHVGDRSSTAVLAATTGCHLNIRSARGSAIFLRSEKKGFKFPILIECSFGSASEIAATLAALL